MVHICQVVIKIEPHLRRCGSCSVTLSTYQRRRFCGSLIKARWAIDCQGTKVLGVQNYHECGSGVPSRAPNANSPPPGGVLHCIQSTPHLTLHHEYNISHTMCCIQHKECMIAYNIHKTDIRAHRQDELGYVCLGQRQGHRVYIHVYTKNT